MYTFSVLMSVYNKEEPAYLKLALESIFDEQTTKPDDMVVVFDGPLTEKLYSVLNEFKSGKEDKVIFVQLEENKGLGEALKIGTEYCKGDYIIRMDSDDISVPNRIEILKQTIMSNPDIDVLGSDIAEFCNSPDEKNKKIRSCPPDLKGIKKRCKTHNPMNHVSTCIKKSSLINNGGYLPLRYVEDYYLWVRMLSNGCRFMNINIPLVNVRIGSGFYKRRSNKEQIANWKTIHKYMLKHKMISPLRYAFNLVSFRLFVCSPAFAKKFVYRVFLRK